MTAALLVLVALLAIWWQARDARHQDLQRAMYFSLGQVVRRVDAMSLLIDQTIERQTDAAVAIARLEASDVPAGTTTADQSEEDEAT